jgi:Tol biopolymer transport system component
VRHEYAWKLWIVTDGDVQRATSIFSGVGIGYGLNWTGNGKIVFSSMTRDTLNISMINPDGSNRTQLTDRAGDNYTPAGSPDGRFIVFSSNRTGTMNIWRMNADDGSDLRQLTFSDGNSYPSCSNESVFYDNQSGSTITVWRVPIEGGEPEQLTVDYARMPVVSPDNRFIAVRSEAQAGRRVIAILPLQGAAPTRMVQIPIRDWQRVQWIADGHALYYVDVENGVSNIWSCDLGTGNLRKITDFKSDQIYAYAWSSDFRQLACERGSSVADVMLISIRK